MRRADVLDNPAASASAPGAPVRPDGEHGVGEHDGTWLRRVRAAVTAQQSFVESRLKAGAALRDGLLWDSQGSLVIPVGELRRELLQEAHDPPYVGHQGRKRTYSQLQLAAVSCVVFVDKLSKMVELVPCKKTIDAVQFAELFVHSIVDRKSVV